MEIRVLMGDKMVLGMRRRVLRVGVLGLWRVGSEEEVDLSPDELGPVGEADAEFGLQLLDDGV